MQSNELEMSCMYADMDINKIEIRGKGELIPMELFLSFLTVECTRNKNCIGSATNWTEFRGPDNLIIQGGILSRSEYLNNIRYKKQLMTPYHDYVSPFQLFEIMTDGGKDFFTEYYREEIDRSLEKSRLAVSDAKERLASANDSHAGAKDFWSAARRNTAT